MVFVYRRRIPEFIVPGKPLGRHVHYDSRSEGYPFVPRTARELAAVLHQRHIGPLDQGNLGSCVGNDLVGNIATSPDFEALPGEHPSLDEPLAVKVYSLATTLDPYPGSYTQAGGWEDTGSDALDGCKAAVKMGLIGGYTHCDTIPSMQQAIMERSLMFDCNWYSGFDDPAPDGFVSIGANDYIRGGHSFEILGMDPVARVFLAENSWGSSWGYNGTFQFSFATAARLLSEEGACIVPLPLAVTPPPPPPPLYPSDASLTAWWQKRYPWVQVNRTRPDLVLVKEEDLRLAREHGLFGA